MGAFGTYDRGGGGRERNSRQQQTTVSTKRQHSRQCTQRLLGFSNLLFFFFLSVPQQQTVVAVGTQPYSVINARLGQTRFFSPVQRPGQVDGYFISWVMLMDCYVTILYLMALDGQKWSDETYCYCISVVATVVGHGRSLFLLLLLLLLLFPPRSSFYSRPLPVARQLVHHDTTGTAAAIQFPLFSLRRRRPSTI